MIYQNGALPKYQCWTKSRGQNRQLDFSWSGQIQRGCGQQTRRLGGGRIGQSRYVFDKGFTVDIYSLHIETDWRGVGEIPIENGDVTIGCEGLQNSGLCPARAGIEHGGFFVVPHLL